MKRWNILAEKKENESSVNIILKNRKISDKKTFLNPPSANTLPKNITKKLRESMEAASKIIKGAVKNDIPIVIHGDYDVDGICATAILMKVIRDELGHNKTMTFLPDRSEHGYGLSFTSIDSLKEKVTDSYGEYKECLMITVDCGITSVDEVEYAAQSGFSVVITDHHQIPDVLPSAVSIVWSDEFTGAGIAWLLGRYLGSKDPELISLAALGTVADLQRLVGYCRSIVKDGLRLMNKNPPVWVQKLRLAAGRDFGRISTYDLGWVVGPRINAAGRIGDAYDSLRLFLEDDIGEITRISKKLNDTNLKRQEKTLEMYELSESVCAEELPRVIFAAHKDYHEGIIGLVAAKLTKDHYRPSIVVSINDDIGKGSVRSVKGIDIISFLREFEDLFESVGGHPMAAGFEIKVENLSSLQEKIMVLSAKYILDEHLIPVLDIDLKIPLDIVNLDFVKKIDVLKPFGVGNPKPVFMSENIGITDMNVVGRDKTHLSLKLNHKGKLYKAIFFGGANYVDRISIGDKIDIAYCVEENTFRGETSVSIVIKDIRV